MNEGLMNQQTNEATYMGINLLFKFMQVKLFSKRTVNELLSGTNQTKLN
jgi:hypothetical protein